MSAVNYPQCIDSHLFEDDDYGGGSFGVVTEIGGEGGGHDTRKTSPRRDKNVSSGGDMHTHTHVHAYTRVHAHVHTHTNRSMDAHTISLSSFTTPLIFFNFMNA